MILLVPVKGIDLRPEMKVRRNADFKEDTETIGQFTGRCQKGLHFGSGCYDVISTWYIERQESGSAKAMAVLLQSMRSKVQDLKA